MDLSDALAADLHDLVVDLEAQSYTRSVVALLSRDLRAAVPSALGYSITLVTEPALPPVRITVAESVVAAASVRSRLECRLRTREPNATATALFYAGRTGAFDALARSLRGALGTSGWVSTSATPIDQPVRPGIVGLTDFTAVNRALGVLIGRGYTLVEARDWLHVEADSQQVEVVTVAEQLMAELGVVI